MTNAEQWLSDLEAKAKAAEKNWEKKYSEDSDGAIRQLEASMNFIDTANPAAVLRLTDMVRFLAFSAARSRGLFMDPAYWIDTAYIATEDHHDQLP